MLVNPIKSLFLEGLIYFFLEHQRLLILLLFGRLIVETTLVTALGKLFDLGLEAFWDFVNRLRLFGLEGFWGTCNFGFDRWDYMLTNHIILELKYAGDQSVRSLFIGDSWLEGGQVYHTVRYRLVLIFILQHVLGGEVLHIGRNDNFRGGPSRGGCCQVE